MRGQLISEWYGWYGNVVGPKRGLNERYGAAGVWGQAVAMYK